VNASRVRMAAKQVLGEIPFAVEAWSFLSGGAAPPASGFRLQEIEDHLESWCKASTDARTRRWSERPRNVLIVSALPWWFEYALATGLLLAADGHRVNLTYLPYRNWREPVDAFDLRRQRHYLRQLLTPAAGLLECIDMSTLPAGETSESLETSLEGLSRIDVQYTYQHEVLDLTPGSRDEVLYRLRLERNRQAAGAIASLLRRIEPEVVIVPNGSILELGAAYRTARDLGWPTVTFEFGEQRERMWIAQNGEAMRLITSDLWDARGDVPLGEAEVAALGEVYRARRGATLWQNFGRKWQASPSQGAQMALKRLDLDPDKPVALLCTNVVGDSLALDRQVFSTGMAEWLTRTVQFFDAHSEVQLVVRVHPGELLGAGHPSTEIVKQATLDLPEGVRVVPPDSDINTYDLIELAHVGLVYTTTVGMEMVMQGVPVIVSGATHYRGKGFTYDPASWDEYLEALGRLLSDPPHRRVPDEQIELATRYAYRFFFEYPFRFPWHLIGFWKDIQARPLEEVVASLGHSRYDETLQALVGHPIDWSEKANSAVRSMADVGR
jgi:hypothetical protein